MSSLDQLSQTMKYKDSWVEERLRLCTKCGAEHLEISTLSRSSTRRTCERRTWQSVSNMR